MTAWVGSLDVSIDSNIIWSLRFRLAQLRNFQTYRWPRTQALFHGGKLRRAWCTMSVHVPKFPEILEIRISITYTTPCTGHKLSMTLLCISTLLLYLPRLLVSAIMKTRGIDYFCLGKVSEPIRSRTFARQERGLTIGDVS